MDVLIEYESDENFYFIAGFTSCGIPYGITWEEAIRDNLISEDEREIIEHRSLVDLPF